MRFDPSVKLTMLTLNIKLANKLEMHFNVDYKHFQISSELAVKQ